MPEDASSPWGLMIFTIFCVVMALAGLIWCVCCGTCAGRNMMRQAGLGRLVPPPFLQPSFNGTYSPSRRSRRKEYDEDEEDGYLDEEALVGSQSSHDVGWWQRANAQTEQLSMKVFGHGGDDDGGVEEDNDGYLSSVEYGYELSDEE